ncbi:hypothetical protein GA0070613_4672 [Micromonospora inositola]|uniref:Uncharacterized protein n=1 Tax=Micromonospora inositola TaxID=47865 RepID=A0A1C5JH72_9ACTN|nr:hypothetical protein GA0070613_4672 [Micromonospora inositola]
MTSVQAAWAGPGFHPHQPLGLLPAAAPTVDPIGHRGTQPALACLASPDCPVALPA